MAAVFIAKNDLFSLMCLGFQLEGPARGEKEAQSLEANQCLASLLRLQTKGPGRMASDVDAFLLGTGLSLSDGCFWSLLS